MFTNGNLAVPVSILSFLGTHLLIGHENSPLHKKTKFQI